MRGGSCVVHSVVCLFSAGQAPSSDNLLSLSTSGSRHGREGGREEGGGISSMRKDAKSSSLSNSPLNAAIVELSTGSDRVIQGC